MKGPFSHEYQFVPKSSGTISAQLGGVGSEAGETRASVLYAVGVSFQQGMVAAARAEPGGHQANRSPSLVISQSRHTAATLT
jgi:hypothetical protein